MGDKGADEAALLPFVPVALMVMPLSDVIKDVAKMLSL
jgi:hypothetical protein